MIKIIFKNPIVKLLLFLTLVVAVLTIYLFVKNLSSGIKKQSLIKPQVESQTVNPINLKYSFIGTLPQLASNDAVYQNQATQLTQNLADQISQKLDFKVSVKIYDDVLGKLYSYSQNNQSLLIYPNPILIAYSNSNPASKEKLNKTQLIEKANAVLNNFKDYFNQNLTLSPAYIQLMMTDFQGAFIKTDDPNEATHAQISFNYLLNQKPIVDTTYQNYPIKIILNLDGSINKFDMLLPPQNLTKLGQVELTNPSQALEAINSGQGTISYLNNPNQAYTNLYDGDIEQASLNSLEIVYLYDPSQHSLQPFYRFSGTAKDKNNEIIDVAVIITALPQDLFKK